MTGFRGSNLLHVNKRIYAEVTDVILRTFPFVHVEIRNHDELVHLLKKRVPSLVLQCPSPKIAIVTDFKHYSMVVRIGTPREAPRIKGVYHLMVIGEAAWTHVVKAIALHVPSRDLDWDGANPPSLLSYEVQLLESYGTTVLQEERHIRLCQPLFDYWWNDYNTVRVISTFNPALAMTLSARLQKHR